MKTRIQHLPADVHGLSAVARAGISSGSSFSPVPVIHRVLDIPRPAERLGVDERGVLADLVDRGLADAGIALAPAARDHLEALRSEGVPCVLTGQQPGFLTSPLYCLYKALQACKVAEELSAAVRTAEDASRCLAAGEVDSACARGARRCHKAHPLSPL